ncbi:MAG TPA: hypothetical protein VGN81_07520 [Pseudonocardiaceae bacterium]
MRVVGQSPEQSYFQRTNKCPHCRRWTFPHLTLPDGTKLGRWILSGETARQALATCTKCGGSWPLFAQPGAIDTVQVLETDRVEDAIGQDVRRIDNSGPASAVRRIKATRRWMQRVEFADDRTSTSTKGIDLFRFKASAETTLHRHFGGSAETEQTFEEGIELSIPPNTVLELVLHWKRIWQRGSVIGTDAAGGTIQLPFRIVVGLTFDQVTR